MAGKRPTGPWEDPTTKRWVQHVINDMVPKLKGSVVAMHVVPEPGQIDVKFCVELGAAIMLDKPIIAVVMGDRQVPRKLRRISEEIIYLPDGVTPEASAELAKAIRRIMAAHP